MEYRSEVLEVLVRILLQKRGDFGDLKLMWVKSKFEIGLWVSYEMRFLTSVGFRSVSFHKIEYRFRSSDLSDYIAINHMLFQ